MSRESRIAAFRPYARTIADDLWLRDWTIILKDEPPDDGSAATINLTNGRKLAHLFLAYDFFDNSAEDQRETLIHELLHCHFGEAGFVVEEESSGEVHRAFIRALEYGIDAVAEAFAPLMPVPSPGFGWPEEP
jgi:hypothetical protein